MGFRFRKSFKLFPGVRLNLGKKGFSSLSVGNKYARTNISGKGVSHGFSIPGTGISYTTSASGKTSKSAHYDNQYPQLSNEQNPPPSVKAKYSPIAICFIGLTALVVLLCVLTFLFK